jgi:hypothetical protein
MLEASNYEPTLDFEGDATGEDGESDRLSMTK